jgi:hypothetical protein
MIFAMKKTISSSSIAAVLSIMAGYMEGLRQECKLKAGQNISKTNPR